MLGAGLESMIRQCIICIQFPCIKFLIDQEGIPADFSTCPVLQRAHVNVKSGVDEDRSDINWNVLKCERLKAGLYLRYKNIFTSPRTA